MEASRVSSVCVRERERERECVCVCVQTEVWVFMELMATCLDRLLKKVGGPFPENIVCKMTVSVS